MPLLFISGAALLAQQVTGTISGYVTDPSGAAIPDSTVTATQVQQQFVRTVKSDEQGFYNFLAMPPGPYSVVAEKEGFQKLVRSELTLTINQNLRADLGMKVGQTSESITVTSAAALVDSRSATLSALVDDRRVVDLPLNGRNVMSLAATLPGVANVSAPQQLSDARSGPTMNVNGSQVNMNLYTFNGGIFNNPSRNTGMNYPPPDALQEFRVLTQNFSAEYGRNAGSQVNVVAKSGTNELHGSAWEFLRNSKLNARNFFASRVPSLKQNQFGAAGGGPIRKDRLFFFGAYQGLRDRPEALAVQSTVPSEAQRAGDLRSLKTTLTNPADILTGKPFADANGYPCVEGNVIRPGCISPTAQKLLAYVPQSATGVISVLSPNPRNDDMYMGRIDWNQSARHMLSGNFYLDRNKQSADISGGTIPGYVGNTQGQQSTMVTLNDTYTFRPTLLNQTTVSFLRTTSLNQPTRNLSPSELGINLPTYAAGAPHFDITGNFSFFGSSGKVLFVNNNWQVRNDLSWIKGKHNFKFGGEFMKLYWRQIYIGNPSFSFNGSRSGDALADFMLGAYRSVSLGFGTRENNDNSIAPSLYFQDEFKVAPRLTLSLGLRYEPAVPWTDKFDRLSAFVYGAQSTRIPDAPQHMLFAGDPGVGRALIGRDLNNFAPRVGFAWDVFGDGKTSVRGAYGIFYDAIKADSVAQENAPWAGNAQAFNGRLENPFVSVGLAAPPATLGDKFGCTKTSSNPGLTCSLFPLPLAGFYLGSALKTPYIQSFNLSVQRQLTPTVMVQVAYIGKVGTKIEARRNFNPAQFINDPVTGAAPSLQNVNNRVLFGPGLYSPLAMIMSNDHRSWYHSFQSQLTRRFAKGFSLSAAYTLGKSLDTLSNNIYARKLDNPFSLAYNRGRSDFDRRHVFVASWLWSPAFKSGQAWQNLALANWTFTGIHSLQSGQPISFAMGDDVALDGTGGRQRAELNGQPIARAHSSRADMIDQFFNINAFVPTAQVARGVYGNSGRNILSGPAMANSDISVIKDIPVKERYKAQFRSEFFNVFNQVNFSNPDSTVNSRNFGRIRSAGSPRVIQFALKFLW